VTGNTESVRVLAVSGSLRKASSNSALVSAAVRVAPAGVEVSVYGELADVAPFNPDLDAGTVPIGVVRFRAALAACDAILMCSPEYAHGVSGVLKNALDWIVSSGELMDKPIALINASGRATLAYASLRETLTTMSGRVIEDASVTIPLEGSKSDAAGLARDGHVSGVLKASLAALARVVRADAGRRAGEDAGREARSVIATYRITTARLEDLSQLSAIELAAARLLEGHAPESVLNETTSLDVLNHAQHDGRLWLALADDVPVGFAYVEVIERDTVHLEEIAVHPDHGRRGLGATLVVRVCEWAAVHGYASVTLTTFRDVPWNMPFYAKLGFAVVPSHTLSAGLRAVVDDETRRGLDSSRRVVMKRPSAAVQG